MKKIRNKILLIIIGIIFISNLPPVYYFLGEEYHYQNFDASFEFTEQPGTTQNFYMASRRFESFKERNPNNINQTLYRTFTIKPWKFWEWWSMISKGKRFKCQYLNFRNHGE
ncbi:hypothetical protein DHW03_15390 [Pedobacter yonginense]|uniref:Uncharacterized protein n=1 Tax=Pedobacter yonginense TaxID=651869 RepID=A0A317EJ76_9SPHI|nr:hypothetical protein [Pedobacter yonginense]PWS26177.1 hypothetical protein DHW03_15390 [Pedobacter yonginense]